MLICIYNLTDGEIFNLWDITNLILGDIYRAIVTYNYIGSAVFIGFNILFISAIGISVKNSYQCDSKYDTYKQWVSQWDREFQTMSWLDCKTEVFAGMKYVTKLKCRICTKFKERIIGRRNFSHRWIDGADSVRTTNIHDYSKSEQHCHTMNLERKSTAQHLDQGPAAYALIARLLITISREEMERLRIKHFLLQQRIWPSQNIQKFVKWKHDMA